MLGFFTQTPYFFFDFGYYPWYYIMKNEDLAFLPPPYTQTHDTCMSTNILPISPFYQYSQIWLDQYPEFYSCDSVLNILNSAK